MILDLLYTLIIFPIETVLGLFYWLFLKMFEIHGIAILLLSVVVNIFLLPLYNVAEKWQQTERNLQKRLKPKLDEIKAVFKGAERHMIIRTYYRQNNYHPVYSLRNVIGLAIQIPFFIAAYHLLSHMPMTASTSSYYFISDLRLEDQLIKIGSVTINLLPIAMTVINLISAFIYSGKLQGREKRQLVIMAFIFLVLLYRSPAGLVLYWTLNNVFSLIKNIILAGKNPGKKFYYLLAGFLLFLFIFSFFLRNSFALELADLGGRVLKRAKVHKINLVTGFILFVVLSIPVVFKYLNRAVEGLISVSGETKKTIIKIFIMSSAVLFLATGVIAPSLLLSASPLEFIEVIDGVAYNPSVALIHSGLQAFSVFLFIPVVLFLLFPGKVRKYITLICLLLSLVAVVNIFLFPGDYGVISSNLTFENPLILNPEKAESLKNVVYVIVLTAIVLFILKKRRYNLILNMLIIISLSLSANLLFNLYNINSEYKSYLSYGAKKGEKSTEYVKYSFTKTGENVVIIMLDRAVGGLMGEILKSNPEFVSQLSGFTWYPNTVSYNARTLLGTPPLFGGYEYTPLEINKRDKETLVDKHNEALLVMPRIFLENNYSVNITDPSIANYSWIPDLSIYDDYPEINAEVIIGKYSNRWIDENIKNSNAPKTKITYLKEYLFNFGLFRASPTLFRFSIYDEGKWQKPSKANLPLKFIDNYSVLEYLTEITDVNFNKNSFNCMVNEVVHEPEILGIFNPDDFKSNYVSDYTSPFSDEYTLKHFYTMIGAFKQLNRWFSFLKENNVYDNTKIVIVSDHGRDVNDPTLSFFWDKKRNRNRYAYFHPLLMVKDFNRKGDINISYDFMTNADVPAIATSHLKNVVNPFTGGKLYKDKDKELVSIITTLNWRWENNGKYKYNFTEEDILRIKDNIFIKENWKRAGK